MILKVTAIADRGNYMKERIVMKATQDVDVGNFAMFRAGLLKDGAITSDTTDAFWFPDKSIKANDVVVLYTKKGTASERVLSLGNTVHFYYWGKSEKLWSGSDHAPVLVYTSDWEKFTDFIT